MVKLLILYGSQTGTAQEYAENVYLEATMKGMQADIIALNDYVKVLGRGLGSSSVLLTRSASS